MTTEEQQPSPLEPPKGWEDKIRATPPLVRWLFRGLAVLFLVLAGIGVILPGMPTTVFVLLAAWAAARSSPELLRWLYRHRLFGPILYNWHHGRTVSRKAKWTAAITMLICGVIIFIFVSNIWIALIPCVIMACVLTWLWSRPEPDSVAPAGDAVDAQGNHTDDKP